MSGLRIAMGAAFCVASVVVAAALVGCDGHLIGTRDVELGYRVTGDARHAPQGELGESVAERVHAADLAVDVEMGDSDAGTATLRVSADEGSIEELDNLLTWQGGLRVYALDAETSIEPKHAEDLTAHEERTPLGSARYFTGPTAAVLRAAHANAPEGGRRLLVDISGPVARTRVAIEPPLADLHDGISSAVADGPTLHLGLSDRARVALAVVASARPHEPVAFVRDATILKVGTIADTVSETGLTLPLGTTPRAYIRAEAAAKLLGTKTLPRLVRTRVTRRPPSYGLASAEVVLPILLSLAWLAFVRRFDRARPEPLWLVLVTFVLGGAAVVPVSLFEWKLADASPYLNPQLMTYGGQITAFPLALVVFALTVGLVEESAKLLAAWAVARQRREFDEPVDGIIYASAAALGFAALENIRYFAAGRVAGGLIVTRAFMSAPAHFLFASLWGYALGQRLIDPRKRVWPLFLASVLAHGAYDTCLSFPDTARVAPLINFALATVFVLMLRSALRHGPVDRSAPNAPRGTRDVYPVGSGFFFALFVVALHASAVALFYFGVYAEQSHDRLGAVFLVAATTLLAIVGLSAYGVSASLPLDVVLDDAGVTFAGAFLAWSSVDRLESRKATSTNGSHRITLVGPTARLALGPVDERSMDNLVAALYARMDRATRARGTEIPPATSAT